MENVKPSSTNLAFKWAIINVLTSIVITYAFQFLNIDQNSPARYLAFIPFIVFLLMAQKEYRDQLGGFLTYGEGFMAGLLFSIFAGLLGAIFIYVYLTFLSPQVFEQSLADAQTKMESKGLSSEQVESAMAITKKYGTLFGAIGTVIGSIFIGAIIALIGAAIFKKERSILDIEQNSDNYTDPAV